MIERFGRVDAIVNTILAATTFQQYDLSAGGEFVPSTMPMLLVYPALREQLGPVLRRRGMVKS